MKYLKVKDCRKKGCGRYSMIKLKCPECDSDKVVFVSSELNEEDCFECEKCNVVYPLSEMGWESE